MHGSEEDEQQVVARATAGDEQAFAELYRRNVDTVFGFLRLRVGANHAEDLTADTFLAAWKGIASYEWRGTPIRAWLLRIAYHQLVSRSRRKSSSEVASDEIWGGVDDAAEDVAMELEQALQLRSMMEQLPESQSAVLDLRFLRELSVSEVAEVLEMSEEAVRALTYRALKAMRRMREDHA